MSGRAFAAAVVAGGALVAVTVVLAATMEIPEPASAISLPAGPVLGIANGAVWLATGLVAWRVRPANRIGPLTAGFGVLLLLPWTLAPLGPLGFTLAALLDELSYPYGAYVFLAFPSGRLTATAQRIVVVAAGVTIGLVPPAELLFRDHAAEGCATCPENLLLLDADTGVADAIVTVSRALAAALTVAVVVLQARRWAAATAPARRVLAPVLGTGVFAVLLFAVGYATGAPYDDEWLAAIPMTAILLVPVAFLTGLLRTRLQRSAVGDLVVDLATPRSLAELRRLLADALGDRSLELVVWLPDAGRYVDVGGHPVPMPEPDATRAVSAIEHDGSPLAALIHDPSLLDEPELVDGVSAAARLALENARLEAELRAQLLIVRDSRTRIVAAGDAERRRIERNLHDGAQQRLLAIRLALRLARRTAATAPAALDGALAEIDAEIAGALDELRALARGLHPPILTEEGLGPALDSLARRAAIPVDVVAVPGGRMPPAVETAAYYVAAEGLANVVKHAHASQVRIAVSRTDGHAVVEVADDGRGGADAGGGGLSGLRDRVEALDGTLTVSSPPECGTTLHAELPCA